MVLTKEIRVTEPTRVMQHPGIFIEIQLIKCMSQTKNYKTKGFEVIVQIQLTTLLKNDEFYTAT